VTEPRDSYLPSGALWFGKRGGRDRRKVESLNGALKVRVLVGAIAERLVCGVTAAAKTYLIASGEAKNLAVLIHYLEISLDSY
jgi:hypothetical protein